MRAPAVHPHQVPDTRTHRASAQPD